MVRALKRAPHAYHLSLFSSLSFSWLCGKVLSQTGYISIYNVIARRSIWVQNQPQNTQWFLFTCIMQQQELNSSFLEMGPDVQIAVPI